MRYRLDLFSIAAFVAVALDTLTTYWFISARLGSELNTVLSPLIRHSLVWIFIYMLIRPLMIPFLPKLSRDVVAAYFLTACGIFGLNNLSGILTGDYFAIRIVGYSGVVAIAITFSCITYLYHCIATKESIDGLFRQTAWLLLFIALCIAIEFSFYGIRWLI